MGLLNVSDKKKSESEYQEMTAPKLRDREQRQVMKLVGNEFRMVKNGLDPAEVSSFIEAATGSNEAALKRLEHFTSEAALKRLEHFTSLRRLSEMMEGMIKETQQVSEQVKEQVKQEAEDEKAQVIEVAKHKAEEMIRQTKKTCIAQIEGINSVILEAKRRAGEMVNQTRDSCLARVEGTNSILLEAATKARQMEEMALQKAKEMGDMNTEAMQKNMQDVVASVHHDLNSLFEQFTKELETSQFRIAEISSDVEEPVSELAEVEESAAASEVPEAEPISNEIEDEEVIPIIKASPVASTEDSAATLYSGKVTLTIPRPAGMVWMSQLRQRLLNSPGVRILLQAGSDKSESILNLSLDEPIPLTSILLEMPNVERLVEKNSKTAKSSEHLSKILKHNLPKELQQTTLVIVLSRNGKSKS